MKYHMAYPNNEQYSLIKNGYVLSNAKKISYLKRKMKEYRVAMLDAGYIEEETYEIVDFRTNEVLFSCTYHKNEYPANFKINEKQEKKKEKEYEFVQIDPHCS